MSELALPAPRQNALLRWLRYDPERVPEVEAAYDGFISRSRYGVAILASLVLTVVVVFVTVALRSSATKAALMGPMLVVGSITFYGTQLLSLVGVPRKTLATVLAGAIDTWRGVLFGFCCGIAIAIVETAIAGLLIALHAKSEPDVDPFASGVVFGLFMVLFLAPFTEEFMMQGWLQTRLRGLRNPWSVNITTIAFVLMHFPSSPMGFVRTLVLGGVGVTRATTRSLGSAVAMHFANNLFFVLASLYAYTGIHHR